MLFADVSTLAFRQLRDDAGPPARLSLVALPLIIALGRLDPQLVPGREDRFCADAGGYPGADRAAARALAEMTQQAPEPGHDLTEREREVLALVVAGMSNLQIARQLNISLSTARFHVSTILSKLGAANRAEAAALAVKLNLVR